MHMLRQDDPGVDVEWTPGSNFPHRRTKGFDLGGQQITAPVLKIHCKKIGAYGNKVAAVIGHVLSVTRDVFGS